MIAGIDPERLPSGPAIMRLHNVGNHEILNRIENGYFHDPGGRPSQAGEGPSIRRKLP